MILIKRAEAGGGAPGRRCAVAKPACKVISGKTDCLAPTTQFQVERYHRGAVIFDPLILWLVSQALVPPKYHCTIHLESGVGDTDSQFLNADWRTTAQTASVCLPVFLSHSVSLSAQRRRDLATAGRNLDAVQLQLSVQITHRGTR